MASSGYPAVTVYVEINNRRTVAQKRALARLVTEACAHVLKASPDDVNVRFRILTFDDMAHGGELVSDARRRATRRRR